MSASTQVDELALAHRLEQLRAVMRSHGGAVELVEVGSDGVVRLRFTDACSGCQFRPLTLEGTIRPALMSVRGVRGVQAAGARISDEALARLRFYLGDAAPVPLPPIGDSDPGRDQQPR